jgi:iron complex outermembrane receptor protein
MAAPSRVPSIWNAAARASNPNAASAARLPAGFEANNSQRILGAAAHYSGPSFYSDLDFTFRGASNYNAGHRSGSSSEVDYSQFTKYNLSAIAGYKLGKDNELEASLILDKATAVGYPGLPMDVSLAQAIIGSVQYRHLPRNGPISLWETKAYYNTITHVMDDSQRPVVPLRMDMPGWSTTQGFYAKAYASSGKHNIKTTWSGHRNNSLAEMTMHPNNPAEPTMFMLTWPDVTTLYNSPERGGPHPRQPQAGPHAACRTGPFTKTPSAANSAAGLWSCFTWTLPSSKQRLLANAGASLAHHRGRFTNRLGLGFSERAPSVSEGYGFYLLNANDNFDYVGDPNMRDESSFSTELSSTYKHGKLQLEWTAAYFHIVDYIVGKPKRACCP